MAGKIIVYSPKEIRGAFFRLDVLLNGVQVAKLKSNEKFEYKISADTEVSGKIFNVPESERIFAKAEDLTRIVFEYKAKEKSLTARIMSEEEKQEAEKAEEAFESLDQGEKTVFRFDGGVKDILLVYEDRIVIQHKGALNAMAMDGIQGDKTVFYSDITAVQFKRAGKFLSGHIQFSMNGGSERRGGILSAASDENSITFTQNYNQQAEEVCQYINSKCREVKGVAAKLGNVQQTSAADELKKFKELLDMGVITQEEFESKKKELLGL